MEADFFEMLARQRGTTVEDIRAMISARIREGFYSADPHSREQWRRIPHEGEVPTQEEWLRYAVERLEADGRKDLLRWYPDI